MFTGLVQHVGVVAEVSPTPAGRGLTIDASGWDHRPAPGDSICVCGCCLTVACPPRAGRLQFDVIPQTLSATTLGSWHKGRRVNLEHAVTASTLMGGHFVQGHIDGVGQVTAVDRADGHRVTIRPPAAHMRLLTPRGSVCIDGVSLTVADVSRDAFAVALIPETLARTTLADLNPGDEVNLESDMIVRAVAHYLSSIQGPA